jgi:putative DNA primase/helicase
VTEPPRDLPPLADVVNLDAARFVPHWSPDESRSDTGNSLRFARLMSGRLRFVPEEDRWIAWDGARWRPDEVGTALDLTREVVTDVRAQMTTIDDPDERTRWRQWAESSQSLHSRKATLTLAESIPALTARAVDLDASGWLLCAPNGTIDLRTGDLKPNDPDDLITRSLGVTFDPDCVTSPELEDFIETFMPDPTHVEYLFKLLGSTLAANNVYRLFIIIHGESTSGKTQFIEAVARALGDYVVPVNTSIFRANQDDKPRPDLLRVLSARLAYAEEGSQEWELHADHVKRITGGGRLVARGMRSNLMVERIPAFTPVIVCNEVPRIHGHDTAVRNRLVTIEFSHPLPRAQEDASKKQTFINDDPTNRALLSRLVRGCVDAYCKGLGDMPIAFAHATHQAFDELGHLRDFLNAMIDDGRLIEVHPDDRPRRDYWKASDFHEAYKDWVKKHGNAEDGRSAMNQRAFCKALHDMGWESARAAGTRWDGKVNPQQWQTAWANP